jgi:hypothetical protein
MPHKRNPVSATVILSAHGAAPGFAAMLFTAMASEHERPAGAWHAEWHLLPSLFGLASGALAEARRLADGTCPGSRADAGEPRCHERPALRRCGRGELSSTLGGGAAQAKLEARPRRSERRAGACARSWSRIPRFRPRSGPRNWTTHSTSGRWSRPRVHGSIAPRRGRTRQTGARDREPVREHAQMPTISANGVELHYELTGPEGRPSSPSRTRSAQRSPCGTRRRGAVRLVSLPALRHAAAMAGRR